MAEISFYLNRQPVTIADADSNRTLLGWLRESARLTGTKEGCNEGDCGACTVIWVDRQGVHHAVNACIMLLPQLHGKSVYTIEGISDGVAMHPVQEEMVSSHASQCGFCTPGIVMSLVAASGNSDPDHDRVLAGNLCRCTGYRPIVDSAIAAERRKDAMPALVANDVATAPASSRDCHLPETLDDLAEWYLDNPDATIVAGATDVGLWITKQLRDISPTCFIAGLEELQQVEAGPGILRIGAAVSLNRFHASIAATYPSLARLIDRFGSVQVRNNATVGGNIANGSPIGDLAPALIALGGSLGLRKGTVRREIPLEDFFVDYGVQDLESGEFVEWLIVPTDQPNLRCHKISKRQDQDISAVCGCFNISIEGGRVKTARIAFGGMAATPRRARTAESFLVGKDWNEDAADRAAALLAEDFTPVSDMRASSEYRMTVAGNLLRRHQIESGGAGVSTRINSLDPDLP